MTATRKKKAEEDLKTLYYYRKGILSIESADNSGLGLYLGQYVFILKYSKERDQFLVQDRAGDKTWTDMVAPIRPVIDGHELYHTSFPLLVENDIKAGSEVCFRTHDGFALIRKEIQNPAKDYKLITNKHLNLKNIPKSYNFALGYPDNLSQKTNSEDY